MRSSGPRPLSGPTFGPGRWPGSRPVFMSVFLLSWLSILLFAGVWVTGATAAEDTYFILPRDSMHVGSVTIHRQNIFPADDDYARSVYGRLANRLHAVTREGVIERGLGLAPGDTVSAADLGSALRRLRSYPFLHDDVDLQLEFAGDTLNLDLTTRDVWTTRPAFQFRKTGTLLTWLVSLEESNLFGLGKGLGGFVGEGEIRSVWGGWYLDRQFLGTHAHLRAVMSRGEDTRALEIAFGRSFDRAATRWGLDLDVRDYAGPFVDRRGGLDGPEWTLERWLVSVAGGPRVSGTNRTALRIKPALYFVRERYTPPDSSDLGRSDLPPAACLGPAMADRDIRAFGVEFDYVHERYSERININSIGRREDFNLGTEMRLRIGYSPRGWGPDEGSWFLMAQGMQGKAMGSRTFLLSRFQGMGQIVDQAFQDARVWTSTAVYRNLSARHTLATRLRADFSHRLYPQHVFGMGAESALRGFEAYRFSGEQILQLNVEDRWILIDNMLGLLSVGAVAFLDGGLPWSEGRRREAEPRVAAGVGLRLLGSRTRGLFVTRVDLAYPIVGKEDGDGWVLSIAAGQAF
jgi:hypothetical protein